MRRRDRDITVVVGIFILLVIVLAVWVDKIIKDNQDKIPYLGYIILGVVIFLVVVGIIISILLKRRRKQTKKVYLDADALLHSTFKGMSGDDFEKFVADVYFKLGYETEKVGRSGDGGIDVRARKDNKMYLIQCKDWNSNRARPEDVSRLHSAVYREQADGGIFVAVSGFTTQAKKEFENEPKIELIDGQGIIDLYKEANSK
jgi:restriction system protein